MLIPVWNSLRTPSTNQEIVYFPSIKLEYLWEMDIWSPSSSEINLRSPTWLLVTIKITAKAYLTCIWWFLYLAKPLSWNSNVLPPILTRIHQENPIERQELICYSIKMKLLFLLYSWMTKKLSKFEIEIANSFSKIINPSICIGISEIVEVVRATALCKSLAITKLITIAFHG